jgi:UDP-glucuronate 4-epimerase
MIVITGGAGFIGSHLVERLLGDGERVLVFDSFDDYYAPEVKWRNLAGTLAAPGCRLRVGDVRDPKALGRALAAEPVSCVIHLAARAGVRPSLADPALYMDVNVTGTMQVLEAARAARVPHVVIASSSSVYGDVTKVPFREGVSEGHPASPYGASKRAMEIVARNYADLHGLRVTSLRFFTAYGPRQRPDMAIHKFARAIDAGQPVTLFGKGDTRRDYTFVADVVDGVVRASRRQGGELYRDYNLGREESVGLEELIDALERALGKKARREHTSEQPGDVRITSADCSRARGELGYAPATSIDAGLAAFVRWLRAG